MSEVGTGRRGGQGAVVQGLAAFGEDLAFTPREVEGLSARKAESVTVCDSPTCALSCPA